MINTFSCSPISRPAGPSKLAPPREQPERQKAAYLRLTLITKLTRWKKDTLNFNKFVPCAHLLAAFQPALSWLKQMVLVGGVGMEIRGSLKGAIDNNNTDLSVLL